MTCELPPPLVSVLCRVNIALARVYCNSWIPAKLKRKCLEFVEISARACRGALPNGFVVEPAMHVDAAAVRTFRAI